MKIINRMIRSLFIYAGSILILGMFISNIANVEMISVRALTLSAIPLSILVVLATSEE